MDNVLTPVRPSLMFGSPMEVSSLAPFVRRFAAPHLATASAILLSAAVASAQPWRSELYPADWTPPTDQLFETGKFVQDFSYAGYHQGERDLPSSVGPVFEVTKYGADPTGRRDSTEAIQTAIDDAAANGSGVVVVPSGTFLVAPRADDNWALRISHSNIVLRGAGRDKTFLVNTSHQMRLKSMILIQGAVERWKEVPPGSPVIPVTRDLLTPTTIIPVQTVEGLKNGDWIIIRADATDAFVSEHHMGDEWGGKGHRLGGVLFQRQIRAIDPQNLTLTVDVPVRYYLKIRDHARVHLASAHLEETGVEHLSLGNLEHPKTKELEGWGALDFAKEGTPAYDVHAAAAITFNHVRNGWIREVGTFVPSENTTEARILSNGIVLSECRGITVENCDFQRALYGGGGGNGYMYRLHYSNECLVRDSLSGFSRHGFVVAGMASSGNVFLRVVARNTQVQVAGNGVTAGKGSDHHMYLSQSNLVDGASTDGDFFDAHYRTSGNAFKTPIHGQTAVHSVFWNLKGLSYHKGFDYIVRSDQARYGYIIGTSGAVHNVSTEGVEPNRTAPVDFTEGVGQGGDLVPVSLYQDQLNRRLNTVNSAGAR